MNVNIKIENGSIVTRLEIAGNTVDFGSKVMTIMLQAYDAHDNKVGKFEYEHQLESFPVPDTHAQWLIVQPLIDNLMAMQPE